MNNIMKCKFLRRIVGRQLQRSRCFIQHGNANGHDFNNIFNETLISLNIINYLFVNNYLFIYNYLFINNYLLLNYLWYRGALSDGTKLFYYYIEIIAMQGKAFFKVFT
jgi:hypothetical protein